jgi:hypothetical protein
MFVMPNDFTPTFLGIGAPKCATTWLAENLRAHPGVFVSNPKEIHYFSSNYQRGRAWYLSHFKGADGCKAIGEFSTSYFHDPLVPQRIFETLGEIKCVAVVREPVERFLSDLKHAVRNEKIDPGERSILSEEVLNTIIASRPELEHRSLYSDAIKNYKSVFDHKNLLIFNQADFKTDPERCLEHLWRYLAVDPSFVPASAGRTVSRGIIPRNAAIERLRKTIYRAARNVPVIVPFVRKSGLSAFYRKLNQGKEIDLSPGARACLWQRFAADWGEVQKYLWRPGDE